MYTFGFERIKKLPNGSCFKYVIETQPFDFWQFSLSSAQIIDNIKYEFGDFPDKIDEIKNIIQEIQKFVGILGGEDPIKIAFTSIPTLCSPFELVGLAKIENNGTSYVFSNDLNYMKYLENKLKW